MTWLKWLWPLGALTILGVVILWHRRYVREHTPSLVADLARWHTSMPLAKPRVLYSGTQPVDLKALAKALKGRKAAKPKPVRDFKIVPDGTRRIG